MYTIEHRTAPSDHFDDRWVAPFDLRQRSRLRITLASGVEARLFLERGTILRGGDCLLTACGKVILVEAAQERVLTVRSTSAQALLRAAYHLGNRHVLLEIGPDYLRLEADPVLQDMVLGMGLDATEEYAPFEPEAGAYRVAHSHHHAHDHDHPS